jgi:hypothetical protein
MILRNVTRAAGGDLGPGWQLIIMPRAAVAIDVAALKTPSTLSRELVVSDLAYDVTTGLVETVVTPSHVGD